MDPRNNSAMDALHTPRTAESRRSASVHPRRLLNLKQLCEKFGVSERTGHKLIAEAWFPAPYQFGLRLFRWDEDEINAALTSAPRRVGLNPEPEQLARGRAEKRSIR